VSTQALGGVPAGEAAVAQRVAQLQALIESTRQVAAGGVVTTAGSSGESATVTQDPSTSFAAALQQATTAGTGGEAGGEYEALVAQAAARNGLDPAVLHGLIEQESGFDPSATSSAGAAGLTQLMPGTASSLGVADPLDAAESIEGGARYLGELMNQFGGNTEDALAAYNAGPGAVDQYGGIPPYAETQSYVSKVLANAQAYQQAHPGDALANGSGVAASTDLTASTGLTASTDLTASTGLTASTTVADNTALAGGTA
jgi:soluble lytic murein transglycosylase-like protein